MAVNKVIYDGETLMDLTGDTVSENTLLAGYTAHDASGRAITGSVVTVPVDSVPTEGSGNAVSSGGAFAAIQAARGVKFTSHLVTLTTGGWGAPSSGDYAGEQRVTISGVSITADTHWDLDIAQSGEDAEADALILAAFGLVTYSNSVDGALLFRCPTTLPDVNIPLDVRIYA